jgi:hypothetical protein
VPKPEDSQPTVTLDPGRHRLILDRIQCGFYNETEPSERIATAVFVALRDLDKGPSLPH